MKYDVLCAGELLVDLVSAEYTDRLGTAKTFNVHPGGSPANLATNLSQLGNAVGLIAAVGRDSFGELLRRHIKNLGLQDDLLSLDKAHPSTLITVTKSTGSPEFEVFRGADQFLNWDSFAKAIAKGIRLFHTTCFALSGQPGRSHLLRAAHLLSQRGVAISIDANYAEKVWPDRNRAQHLLTQFAEYGALIKLSDDDYERLYQAPLKQANCAAQVQHLLDAGAQVVCCTFGKEGTVVVSSNEVVRLSAKPVSVVDTTGAGDSFWSGFLTAYLAGCTWKACATVAAEVAAVKLGQQGPLKEPLDWRAFLRG